MKEFVLSVVIPVYNEEHNIDPLLDRLLSILKDYHYELIFIDDGSKDATVEKIKHHTKTNKNIKLITFNRNFGHQMALIAGYTVSKGDGVITLDADLQDPPEIIPQMIEEWNKGCKIVYAKRQSREVDGFFKKKTAEWFYQWMNFLSDNRIPQNVGDFRLLDREVVQFLITLPEHSPFLRGLVAWSGYPEGYVYFVREKRHAGSTHYSLPRMINFALDGITSFSTKPLRLASYMGFMAATFGFLGVVYAILGRFFLPTHWVTGWTGLFVGIMFLGGVQLITIGIIGEYISKIFQEVQNRPHYLVKEKINV
jgi:dolichol-phosphate mannosyltransferase